jgi:hypothetical protein
MNAFDIVKMIKGNSDIAKMAVNDPQTFTGKAIQKLGEHIPNDGQLSIIKDNLPLLIGIAEVTPEFQAGFNAWLKEVEALKNGG